MCTARLNDPCKSYICGLSKSKTSTARSRGEIYNQIRAECKLGVTSTSETVTKTSRGTSASWCRILAKVRWMCLRNLFSLEATASFILGSGGKSSSYFLFLINLQHVPGLNFPFAFNSHTYLVALLCVCYHLALSL